MTAALRAIAYRETGDRLLTYWDMRDTLARMAAELGRMHRDARHDHAGLAADLLADAMAELGRAIDCESAGRRPDDGRPE